MIEEFVYTKIMIQIQQTCSCYFMKVDFASIFTFYDRTFNCWDLQFYLYCLILLIQHLLFLSLWTDWGEGEAELSHVTIMCSITYISYQAASGPPVCMQRNEALPVILMSSCCHRRALGLFSNTHSLSLTTNQNPIVVVRKPRAHVILKNRNKKYTL